MSAQLESILSAVGEAWAPDTDLTVSEWADAHRMLSSSSASEHGPWRTSRVPYLREIMDALSVSSPVEDLTFMKGSQIGATEAGLCWIGYSIHHAPGPMLMIEPTLDACKKISEERIAPMIDDSPELSARVRPPRSRDSGNTTLKKRFTGGVLYMAGTNSAAGLRMVPVGRLFGDEIDGYPGDVGDEGDPLALAIRRTTNFPRRKIYRVSTPTVTGRSRIAKEYKTTDQRRYFLPCPECGAFEFLTWDGRDWMGSPTGTHYRVEWEPDLPETARIVCPHCSARIEERHKQAMLAAGHWAPTAPERMDPRRRGYHLSGLYSPWQTWAQVAVDFLDSKDQPTALKVWVNTTLGETFEERGTRVDAETLFGRREGYGTVAGRNERAEVPPGVGILVASVDVQDSWLECLVMGYGAGQEAWPVAWSQFAGDPGHLGAKEGDPWKDLDVFLRGRFLHASGQRMPIECVTIDLRGHHTEEVYRFAAVRQSRTVLEGGLTHRQLLYPIHGISVPSKTIVGAPSRKNRYRVRMYPIGTNAAKDEIYSRLRMQQPGPGFIHMPDWFTEEHIAQLTAEKAINKWGRAGWERVWINPDSRRNEMLDLNVYALAALHILGPALVKDLGARAERWAALPGAPAARPPDLEAVAHALEEADPGDAPTPPTSPRMRPRRSGWLDKWRR